MPLGGDEGAVIGTDGNCFVCAATVLGPRRVKPLGTPGGLTADLFVQEISPGEEGATGTGVGKSGVISTRLFDFL